MGCRGQGNGGLAAAVGVKHTLVVLLKTGDQVGLVSGLRKAALGKQLLQVGDLESRVVGHGDCCAGRNASVTYGAGEERSFLATKLKNERFSGWDRRDWTRQRSKERRSLEVEWRMGEEGWWMEDGKVRLVQLGEREMVQRWVNQGACRAADAAKGWPYAVYALDAYYST